MTDKQLVQVRTLEVHRAYDVRREVGEVYEADPNTAAHLVAFNYVERVLVERDWTLLPDRELRAEQLPDPAWPKIVACVNIWNDTSALRETLPTWIDHVDAIVVADGPYTTTGSTEAQSTDGLVEFVAGLLDADRPELEAHQVPPQVWPDQNAKRTALIQYAAEKYPGALLLIVDADEYVNGAERLRETPYGDVAWVRLVNSPTYKRPYSQPRLVRAVPGLRYDGRHHWLYRGDDLLATHQYGGAGVEHRWAPITLRNVRGLGHSPARAAAKQQHMLAQFAREQAKTTGTGQASDRSVGARESLRIAQTSIYDAGFVGYRLHTALNTTTPHSSALFTDRTPARNPFQGPGQFDLNGDQQELWNLLSQADVVHCHLDYSGIDRVKVKPERLVIHHHGTMFRKTPGPGWYNVFDPMRAGLRLVSNLELLQYGDGLHFLPNPVPVARYRRLRATTPRHAGPFRIAHSPSKRELKGTEAFLAVCERLRSKGVNVEPLLIERQSHADALALKGTADACFDSFWLGMQCSGLEAAAMGLPVIAGDKHVATEYRKQFGEVPYTFADTEAELEAAIVQLVTDAEFYRTEAARVSRYVTQHHDDAAVALRYLDLLDDAFQWRQAMQALRATGPVIPEALQPMPVVAPVVVVPATTEPVQPTRRQREPKRAKQPKLARRSA